GLAALEHRFGLPAPELEVDVRVRANGDDDLAPGREVDAVDVLRVLASLDRSREGRARPVERGERRLAGAGEAVRPDEVDRLVWLLRVGRGRLARQGGRDVEDPVARVGVPAALADVA